MAENNQNANERDELLAARLEQMRIERQNELKAIERLGSAADGRERAVERLLRGSQENENEGAGTSLSPPRRNPNEAVLVEVRGLFESRPVSNILQSSSFRRELESLVRSGLSRFVVPSANARRAPSAAASSVVPPLPPVTQPPRPASPAPSTVSSSSSMFTDRSVQPAANNTTGRAIPTLTLSEIERIRREEFVEEISELLHNQLVTSTLDGRFRSSLENNIRYRAQQLPPNSSHMAIQALQRLPPSNIVRNDFSHLGIFQNAELHDHTSDHDDGISIVSATAQAVPMRETNSAVNRQLVQVKKEMSEMQNMMKLMMENQLELQRMIRHEISAAVSSSQPEVLARASLAAASSTPVTSAGLCLICIDSKADTAVYKCGHLCLCQNCCVRLRTRREPLKCPVCRAPITDMVRVFNSGVSPDDSTDA